MERSDGGEVSRESRGRRGRGDEGRRWRRGEDDLVDVDRRGQAMRNRIGGEGVSFVASVIVAAFYPWCGRRGVGADDGRTSTTDDGAK